MTARSLALILPLYVALGVACRSDSSAPELQPVLATIELKPSSQVLHPGGEKQLTLLARDQFGSPLYERHPGDWAAQTTYASSDPTIAKVTNSGLVTAVAPGMAEITVTLTLAGASVSGSMALTVPGPLDSATVTVDRTGRWYPTTVDVKAGASVTWVIPNGVSVNTIWLNVWDDDAEVLEFTDGRATRTFSAPGTVYYGTGFGLMWDEEGGRVRVWSIPRIGAEGPTASR